MTFLRILKNSDEFSILNFRSPFRYGTGRYLSNRVSFSKVPVFSLLSYSAYLRFILLQRCLMTFCHSNIWNSWWWRTSTVRVSTKNRFRTRFQNSDNLVELKPCLETFDISQVSGLHEPTFDSWDPFLSLFYFSRRYDISKTELLLRQDCSLFVYQVFRLHLFAKQNRQFVRCWW